MGRDRLKVGVVGLGMGCGHVAAYRQMDCAELVAICDIDERWLSRCKEEWGVPHAFTDYNEMFAMEGLDAVTVALPTYLHMAGTLAALNAGKHVLVEKPMASTAKEAEQMSAAARSNNRTLMVSHNQRFTPEVRYLKRCVDAGMLGDIYLARTVWRRPLGMLPAPVMHRVTGSYNRNWFNEAARGGGVARDLGSHMIDVAMWLMGFPEPADVSGSAYTVFGPEWVKDKGVIFDADDHSVGLVRFKNGASLQVEASFGSHTDREVIATDLFGSRGGATRVPLAVFSEAAGAFTTMTPRLDEPAASAQAEFVDSILAGRSPLVTPEQGITVMRIIDAIRGGANSIEAQHPNTEEHGR